MELKYQYMTWDSRSPTEYQVWNPGNSWPKTQRLPVFDHPWRLKGTFFVEGWELVSVSHFRYGFFWLSLYEVYWFRRLIN